MFLYLIARLLAFLVRRLPQRFLYGLAAILGEAMYLSWPRARRTARENVRLALGTGATASAVNRGARGAFRNYVRYMVEFLRDNQEYEDRVSLAGLENIDEALRAGKGAILVSLHMGSWDLGAVAVARRRYRLNVVVDQFLNDRVNRWVQKARARLGTRVIAARDGMPSLIRALRHNEVLALLIDCPALGNVKVKFLGARAKVPGGAAALSLRTGAQVLPTVMVRLRGNRFKLLFEKPLKFEPSGEFARDVEAFTQRIMESLERLVKEYPDQWFMFRRMWV